MAASYSRSSKERSVVLLEVMGFKGLTIKIMVIDELVIIGRLQLSALYHSHQVYLLLLWGTKLSLVG